MITGKFSQRHFLPKKPLSRSRKNFIRNGDTDEFWKLNLGERHERNKIQGME